jgi:hypothetical protein
MTQPDNPAPETIKYGIPLAFDPADHRESGPDDDDIPNTDVRYMQAIADKMPLQQMWKTGVFQTVEFDSAVITALGHAKMFLVGGIEQAHVTADDLITLATFILEYRSPAPTPAWAPAYTAPTWPNAAAGIPDADVDADADADDNSEESK